MRNQAKALPYLLVNLLCFYLVPLFAPEQPAALLLVLFPIVTVACSLAAGTKAGFCWLYPLCAALLFLPSILLYYNRSAWVYSPLYGLLALIGLFFGWVVHRFGRTGSHTLRR